MAFIKKTIIVSLLLGVSFFMLTKCALHGQTVFEINDFKAESNSISIVDAAKYHGSILRLSPASENKVGAAWYKRRKIDLSAGFHTDFEFKISDKDVQNNGGDGFAFVIQNQGVDEGAGLGDKIGYKDIQYAVAIEIDIFNNDEESKNHVCLSFYDDSKGDYNRYATVHEIPEVNDGNSHFARIEYSEGRLIFFLDSYIFPILSVKIDLEDKVRAADGKAYVGFTSATSEAYANHDLISWSMSQYVEPPEINISDRSINNKDEISVKSRKVKITIWDDNLIDGDTISLKIDDKWILTNYGVQKKRKFIYYTMTGFENEVILYAHNIGKIPPNTAAVTIDDGFKTIKLSVKSDLESSESFTLRYKPDE